jgi:CRISPR-associated protein (TIGR02584 family)
MPAQPGPADACAHRVLLAVTGLSPQVVTETLYALAVERRWCPTRVCIVTTRCGGEQARAALLGEGWLDRLREDYRLPEIAFGAEDIRVITGSDGMPLDDILVDADNVAVADFITEEVRAITADPAVSLHVSIAGGRKTMGFYVGYALSLFGRTQDRLSHVLVSRPFESSPGFFYPAPSSRFIPGSSLDAQDGRVHLSDIPFVRLREGLPRSLLDGHATFSGTVAEAQRALPPVSLRLEPATRTVVAGGERLVLSPQQFALYWMMAERCRSGRQGVHWSDRGLGEDLLGYYGRLVGVHSGLYEQAAKAYRSFGKDNFDPQKAHVNRAIRLALGGRRAAPYLLVRLEPIPGGLRHRVGLALPRDAIAIAAASLRLRRTAAAKAHMGQSRTLRARIRP